MTRRDAGLGLTALIALLVLGAQGGSSATMTSGGESESEPVTLHVGGRDIIVTPADAREMQRALQTYLDAAKKTPPPGLSADEIGHLARAGEPFIGEDRVLRLGAWLLEKRGDAPVLTYTIRGEQIRLIYIAHLTKVDDRWTVSEISLQRVWRARGQ